MFQISSGLLVMAFVNSAFSTDTINEEPTPEFIRPIGNVSVAIGKEAILTCAVSDLGDYRLGWVRLTDQTILSLHTHVVTPSSRFLTTYDNQNQWKLHIKGVTEKDIGCYMCQINTKVMKNQIGCLDVLIPPDIKEEGTSHDVIVKEGNDASLTCNAFGVPMPKVIWKREDSKTLVLNGGSFTDSHVGDTFKQRNSDLVASPGDSDTRKQRNSHLVASPGDGDTRKQRDSDLIASPGDGDTHKQRDSHLVASPGDGDTRKQRDSHLAASPGDGDTHKQRDSHLAASPGDGDTRKQRDSHLAASPGDGDTRKQRDSHLVASPGDGDTRKQRDSHLVASPGDGDTHKQRDSHLVASPGDGDTRKQRDSHLAASPGDGDTRKQRDSHLAASPGDGDTHKQRDSHLAASPGDGDTRKQRDSHLAASPGDGDTRKQRDSHLVASPGDGDTRKQRDSHLVASPDDSHVVGPTIHFTNVSRKQSGNYLCIATNEVPPAVSKLIALHVQFEPKLTIDNKVVGAVVGGVASLSCTVEMFPLSPAYWSKSNSRCGDRCRVEETKNSYMWQTKLIITNVSSEDFRFYHCTAENEEKRLTKLVRLYEITPPTTAPPPTTSTTTETTTTTVKVTTTTKARRPRVTTSTSTETAPQNYQVPVVIENGVRIEGDVTVGNPSSGSRRSDVIKSRASSIHRSVAQLFLLGFFWLMDQTLRQ